MDNKGNIRLLFGEHINITRFENDYNFTSYFEMTVLKNITMQEYKLNEI